MKATHVGLPGSSGKSFDLSPGLSGDASVRCGSAGTWGTLLEVPIGAFGLSGSESSGALNDSRKL
eukprot:13826232-Alexandrium_andersonii.AAC.1